MGTEPSQYTVLPVQRSTGLLGDWAGPIWSAAESVEIAHFYDRPQATEHRPKTEAKLLYSAQGVYLHFRVADRFVRAVEQGYHSSVCGDSCVEWFVEPVAGAGYFNLEINAGGTMLLYHITGRAQNRVMTPVPGEWMDQILVQHSLPSTVEPELVGEIIWTIEAFVPFDLFRAMLPGRTVSPSVQGWRCNFYKCGDKTSHPHWASWQPVGEAPFTFHQPNRFAPIIFA
ncbi:carbohydrate-binding family 9-like protein [Puniceicoccus vermicola]|uniref:Carbohydrate-binding family 9-like protein n=1 Tax=Puniceicoccus vermicola TaxID=388746 RepID=A0A7X1B050_9BACT|nr:carbohydrate-binding family 9-like protein [Puniceicoccus vermicola]MBC2603188.1 carbohydrate-binding family 9-like protein [Puniceicoccus vermicola]